MRLTQPKLAPYIFFISLSLTFMACNSDSGDKNENDEIHIHDSGDGDSVDPKEDSDYFPDRDSEAEPDETVQTEMESSEQDQYVIVDEDIGDEDSIADESSHDEMTEDEEDVLSDEEYDSSEEDETPVDEDFTPDPVVVTDRLWPLNFGDSHVTLWKDDKLGAISISIDDNVAKDHDWWIETGKKYDYRFTWFVITERPSPEGEGGYWGDWDDFKTLYDHGHDIQSHTVSHLHGEYTITEEYADSKALIEKKIGNRVIALAYPGSDGPPPNDPEVAKDYYIAARGTTGHLNKIGKTNYMETNSISSFQYETDHWASINNILTLDPVKKDSYRAWQVMHFHGIEEKKDMLTEGLDFVKAHEDDFWMALFREAALYGQERDSAKLEVLSADENGEIRLRLRDKMRDDLFDFPLTVKVRIGSGWNSGNIEVKQGGKVCNFKMIKHDSKKYILLYAVPDRGEIIIKKLN